MTRRMNRSFPDNALLSGTKQPGAGPEPYFDWKRYGGNFDGSLINRPANNTPL